MKKILIIQGGGRPNGNTAQLVQAFAKGAEDAGHEVEIISLHARIKALIGAGQHRAFLRYFARSAKSNCL